MPLAVQPPVVVAERPDAWLAAPAVTSKATAWLSIPSAAGFADVVTRRSGDALVVHIGGKPLVVFAGGCEPGDECDAVRAAAPIGPADFAYAVTAGAAATYVAAVNARGRTTVLRANERPADAARLMLATSGGTIVWVEAGAIVSRNPNTGVVRRVAAPNRVGGDVTSVAAAGERVIWSARDGDTTRVRMRIGNAPVAELMVARGPVPSAGWPWRPMRRTGRARPAGRRPWARAGGDRDRAARRGSQGHRPLGPLRRRGAGGAAAHRGGRHADRLPAALRGAPG